MRVEIRVFPLFVAKRVGGIFSYDILLYDFLFRRQWGSFSQSFARIGLLFIKWRQVEHKAARARGLSWFGSRARFHALRCTSSDLHSKNKKKYIFMFRTRFDIHSSVHLARVSIVAYAKWTLSFDVSKCKQSGPCELLSTCRITRCVFDEWKQVQTMCLLARTHVTRGTLTFFCRDTIEFFLVIKNIHKIIFNFIFLK